MNVAPVSNSHLKSTDHLETNRSIDQKISMKLHPPPPTPFSDLSTSLEVVCYVFSLYFCPDLVPV